MRKGFDMSTAVSSQHGTSFHQSKFIFNMNTNASELECNAGIVKSSLAHENNSYSTAPHNNLSLPQGMQHESNNS